MQTDLPPPTDTVPTECDRCGTACRRDLDGLETPHTLPCGRQCELTAQSDDRDTCNGRCPVCRRAYTGCGGIYDRCGREGCSECGVHATGEYGQIVCGRAPPSALCAWVWPRVTCAACLKRRPAERDAA